MATYDNNCPAWPSKVYTLGKPARNTQNRMAPALSSYVLLGCQRCCTRFCTRLEYWRSLSFGHSSPQNNVSLFNLCPATSRLPTLHKPVRHYRTAQSTECPQGSHQHELVMLLRERQMGPLERVTDCPRRGRPGPSCPMDWQIIAGLH